MYLSGALWLPEVLAQPAPWSGWLSGALCSHEVLSQPLGLVGSQHPWWVSCYRNGGRPFPPTREPSGWHVLQRPCIVQHSHEKLRRSHACASSQVEHAKLVESDGGQVRAVGTGQYSVLPVQLVLVSRWRGQRKGT
eukprot:361678-Chlamydomonas_euryale.AAC.4